MAARRGRRPLGQDPQRVRLYPRRIEADYSKRLARRMRMVGDLVLEAYRATGSVQTAVARVREALRATPVTEAELTRYGRQAGAYTVNATTRELARKMGSREARSVARQARVRVDAAGPVGIGDAARTRYERGFFLQLGVLGLPMPSGPITDWAVQNAQLIGGLEQRVLDELERDDRTARWSDVLGVASDVQGGMAAGQATEEIARHIGDRLGIAERRARLIARDQIGKLTGKITQARHESLGVTHYRWQTSEDERVRDSHRALNDTIRRWDDPHPTEGHPGQAIQCRCVAVPVLPGDPAIEEYEAERGGGLPAARVLPVEEIGPARTPMAPPSPRPPTPTVEAAAVPRAVEDWRAYARSGAGGGASGEHGTSTVNPAYTGEIDPLVVHLPRGQRMQPEDFAPARVPVDQLRSSQKYVNGAHVETLLGEGPEVSRPRIQVLQNADGTYQIIDGNHRAAAARFRDGQMVEVDVWQGEVEDTDGNVFANSEQAAAPPVASESEEDAVPAGPNGVPLPAWFVEATQGSEPPAVTTDPAVPSTGPLEDRIRSAIDRLPKEAGSVRLADLREALPDVEREDLDAELRRLTRARSLTANPEDNPLDRTERDAEAAFRLGGHDVQWIGTPPRRQPAAVPGTPPPAPAPVSVDVAALSSRIRKRSGERQVEGLSDLSQDERDALVATTLFTGERAGNIRDPSRTVRDPSEAVVIATDPRTGETLTADETDPATFARAREVIGALAQGPISETDREELDAREGHRIGRSMRLNRRQVDRMVYRGTREPAALLRSLKPGETLDLGPARSFSALREGAAHFIDDIGGGGGAPVDVQREKKQQRPVLYVLLNPDRGYLARNLHIDGRGEAEFVAGGEWQVHEVVRAKRAKQLRWGIDADVIFLAPKGTPLPDEPLKTDRQLGF